MSNVFGVKYAWMTGKLVEWEKATVHIASSLGLCGAGVFEGIRAYKSSSSQELRLFRMHDHITRLFDSAKFHRMEIPFSSKDIMQAIIRVISENEFEDDVYVR